MINVANTLAPRDSSERSPFEFFVCCLADRGAFAERMPEPEKVHALEKTPGFQWSVVKSLSSLIRKCRPDVLHSHNLGPLFYSALASKFGRTTPIVHGEHGIFDEENRRKRRMLQRRLLYRCCHSVHTVSPSLRDEIESLGLHHPRLCSIRNGVDTQRFRPAEHEKTAARAELGLEKLDPSDSMIGIVGRFGAHKGHLPLIEAFEKYVAVEEAGEGTLQGKAHLVVAGDGGASRDAVVERMQASSCRNRIHWLGHCDQPELVYRALDLMLFPSSHEGLSNALLEALSSGVPILAASACGNDEAIRDGENGWLRKLDTAGDILQQLRQIPSNDDIIQQVSAAARHTAVTEFSLHAMASGYKNLYREAASSAGV